MRIQPDHLHALPSSSLALPPLGRHAEAVADLTALLAFTPRNGDVYQQRARSYDALKDPVRAKADREKALQLAPNNPSSLNIRAWDLLTGPAEMRDPARALELAKRAVDLAPASQLY